MARVSDNILPEGFVPYLTLDRYQEIMRLPIAAFNGLNKPNEEAQYQCSEIWNQSERDYLAEHLAWAEELREGELGYPLFPKYFDEIEYEYKYPLILDNKHLIRVGTQKSSDIALAEALDLGLETAPNDPVTITVATVVTSSDEVKVYYPDEDVEIHLSSVVISGGNAIIKIPRSRLVDPALLDDREDHLSYYENDNFLTTVDIKRLYYDDTDAAYFVWDYSACDSPTETTQLANAKIVDKRRAIINTFPATYIDGVWKLTGFSVCGFPNGIRVNYVAGRQKSMITEITTARLAHTNMPNKPCSCPTVHMYWEEDTQPTDSITPYGSKKGAVDAWVADSRLKVGQGGKFPSMRSYG